MFWWAIDCIIMNSFINQLYILCKSRLIVCYICRLCMVMCLEVSIIAYQVYFFRPPWKIQHQLCPVKVARLFLYIKFSKTNDCFRFSFVHPSIYHLSRRCILEADLGTMTLMMCLLFTSNWFSICGTLL